jgi:hypothetical protein
MDSETHILLSGALTFGVPLILAIRELFILRRDNRGGGWHDPAPDPLPVPPRPPMGQKPLPDCLIPKRLDRARQPELV